MAVKQKPPKVGGEVELFFEKPGGGDLKVKPLSRGKFHGVFDGHTIWFVPEKLIQEEANLTEVLAPMVEDPNKLDRMLATVHKAAREFAGQYQALLRVVPFRHGRESESHKTRRTVLGGHIQYQGGNWRDRAGRLKMDKVIRDSQLIRAHAMPFLYVDAGIERVCRLTSPCIPSDRLYLRNKTRDNLPEGDYWLRYKLPTEENREMMLSVEEINIPGEEKLVRQLSLEVRNPPSGPAMGKHALDILVAVKQPQFEGGFNVPLRQESDVWGPLEAKSEIGGPDIQGLLFSCRWSKSTQNLFDLQEKVETFTEKDLGPDTKRMKEIVGGLNPRDFKVEESNAAVFKEYADTAKSAARLRYKAEVKYAGERMLMRDAYARHYLKNRKVYDKADPAVHEWVRAATDNGFSYTDFRLALRGVFKERDLFNIVVDNLMAGAYTLDADGRRPTMASVLEGYTADYLEDGEMVFLRGLAVFLSHRQSNTAAEGEVPAGVEKREVQDHVFARVRASDVDNIGRLLDACFMYSSAGRMPDGNGFFDLEYNPSLPRDGRIREALMR
jgi:hypothetical protein